MTFATTSSFLSSCGLLVPLFALVRAACFSVAVAPRQSAKSIVEDCQTLGPKRNKQLYQLSLQALVRDTRRQNPMRSNIASLARHAKELERTFCLLSSSSTIA